MGGKSQSQRSLQPPTDDFGLHVALPIAALTIAASLLLLGVVWWASGRAGSDTSVMASRRVLQGAIDNRRAFLADEVVDDAVWNAAFQELHDAADPATVGQGMAQLINGTAGVDASFVIGPEGKIIYATRNSTATGDIGTGIPLGLRSLVKSLRSARSEAPLTRLILFAGKPAIASAAIVRQEPEHGNAIPGLLLLFVDLLDQRMLAQFSHDFGLPIFIGRSPAKPLSLATLTLTAGNGDALGTLAWQVELPGRAMLVQTAPPLAGTIGLFGLLTALVLGNARRTARLLHLAQTQATHDPLTGLPNRCC